MALYFHFEKNNCAEEAVFTLFPNFSLRFNAVLVSEARFFVEW